jgi:hypothetical protein
MRTQLELLQALLSNLGTPASEALTAEHVEKLGGLGNGRALLPVIRAVLALRGPAWDFPGNWVKGTPSPFKALRFLNLIKLVLELDDFRAHLPRGLGPRHPRRSVLERRRCARDCWRSWTIPAFR